MLVLAQIQPYNISAAISKKYSCHINKNVYHKQIVSKIKALDDKLHKTLLKCNGPPNNTLDQYTCNLLWNDVEEMSKHMCFMVEDLELIEKE